MAWAFDFSGGLHEVAGPVNEVGIFETEREAAEAALGLLRTLLENQHAQVERALRSEREILDDILRLRRRMSAMGGE